jgi:hypothetical protein
VNVYACDDCGHDLALHPMYRSDGTCVDCPCKRTRIEAATHRCVNAGDDARHAKRPTTLIGPRIGHMCVTCVRLRKKTKKTVAKEKRLERIFELTPEMVQAIRDEMPKNARGIPVCPGCLTATGESKALATDHDHDLEKAGLPMVETIRGFLCSTCNQMIEKYGVPGFLRLIDYIENPPAPRALAKLRNRL